MKTILITIAIVFSGMLMQAQTQTQTYNVNVKHVKTGDEYTPVDLCQPGFSHLYKANESQRTTKTYVNKSSAKKNTSNKDRRTVNVTGTYVSHGKDTKVYLTVVGQKSFSDNWILNVYKIPKHIH